MLTLRVATYAAALVFIASPVYRAERVPSPPDSSFDYIIVGGGAAGCSAAWQLTQNNYSVLLLERGAPPPQAPHLL